MALIRARFWNAGRVKDRNKRTLNDVEKLILHKQTTAETATNTPGSTGRMYWLGDGHGPPMRDTSCRWPILKGNR
jgi:hypothetical protein